MFLAPFLEFLHRFLPLPSYFAPETMKRSYAGILQYFKQFFSTCVHEVPKVRSFWAESFWVQTLYNNSLEQNMVHIVVI